MDTVEYILPLYWASYLVNNDDSGLDREDLEEINIFLNRKNVSNAITCEEVGFRWGNDANDLGADCGNFTFWLDL